jgi:hypothetical protein
LVPLSLLVLVKVLLQQRFLFSSSSTIVLSAGTTAMRTNPAILIMVAMAGQNFYHNSISFSISAWVIVGLVVP